MSCLAAIDIGSNAIRLTLAERSAPGKFDEIQKLRVPLRLGAEVFGGAGEFSESTIEEMARVFVGFRELMDKHQVGQCKALATSACRDARNKAALYQRVQEASGIVIEEINGDQEANMILAAVSKVMSFPAEHDYLLFDLGGGSIELSKVEHGRVVGSKSFNIGTVRLFQIEQAYGRHSPESIALLHQFRELLKDFMDQEMLTSKSLRLIGTGGNFRRLMKLKRQLIKGRENYLVPEEISYLTHLIDQTRYEDRIKFYGLKPDRAQVLPGALDLIQTVVDFLPVKRVYTPKVGLIEAILYELAQSSPQNKS